MYLKRYLRIGLLPVVCVYLGGMTPTHHGIAQEAGIAQETIEQPAVKSAIPQEATDAESQLQSPTKFLRVRRQGQQLQSMDTAVVSYAVEGGQGIQVDLIGAVHVGEASYYAQLNSLFDQYDVLLYELVAPEGTVIPLGGKPAAGFNPVAWMQGGAKSMLGLELQLEQIDYTKSHLIRADMTPRQLADKMEERGDTAFTLALETLAEVMRQQNLATKNSAYDEPGASARDISLSDLLANPLKMKRIMAEQFAISGSLDESLGSSLSQLLIADRNAAALKELQKQMAAGKKKIAIFYGAAHLPDFEERLVADFGLQKTSQNWLTAWDLTQATAPALSEPVGMLLNMLKTLE